jgi:hypothetical protein
MTKWDRFAGWPGRDNIADLHSSVDHYHSIDQQLDQLTSLCKIQLLQHWRRALAKGAQAFGQAHDIQMLLCLRIQLPQLVLQALLHVGNFLSLSLEPFPTNNLRQIHLQQAGLLALQLCQGLPQRLALRQKGLGQPLPALSSQQFMRQQCRFSQNSAQILPNQFIQLMSWDVARIAALPASLPQAVRPPSADIVVVSWRDQPSSACHQALGAAHQSASRYLCAVLLRRANCLFWSKRTWAISNCSRLTSAGTKMFIHSSGGVGFVLMPGPTGCSGDFRRLAATDRVRPNAALPI